MTSSLFGSCFLKSTKKPCVTLSSCSRSYIPTRRHLSRHFTSTLTAHGIINFRLRCLRRTTQQAQISKETLSLHSSFANRTSGRNTNQNTSEETVSTNQKHLILPTTSLGSMMCDTSNDCGVFSHLLPCLAMELVPSSFDLESGGRLNHRTPTTSIERVFPFHSVLFACVVIMIHSEVFSDDSHTHSTELPLRCDVSNHPLIFYYRFDLSIPDKRLVKCPTTTKRKWFIAFTLKTPRFLRLCLDLSTIVLK